MKKIAWKVVIVAILICVAVVILAPILNKAEARTGRYKQSSPALRAAQSAYEERLRSASNSWRADKRYEDAEDEFSEMLEEAPGNVTILLELVQLYREQSKDVEEYEAIDQIVNPRGNWGSSLESDPRLLSRFMLLSESLGETATYLSARESLLDIGPVVVGSHLPIVKGKRTGSQAEITSAALTIAGARLAKGNTFIADAAPLLEEALERNPNNDVAAFYLGYVYKALHRKDECIAMFRIARELSHDDVLIREPDRMLTALGAQ